MDELVKEWRSRIDTDIDVCSCDTAYELAGPVRYSGWWPALDNCAVHHSPASRTNFNSTEYAQRSLRSATNCPEEHNNGPGNCSVHVDPVLETAEHTYHVKSSVLCSANFSTGSLSCSSLHHSRSVLQCTDECWTKHVVEESVLRNLEPDILHSHGRWGEWCQQGHFRPFSAV